jgi:hypothetical protein
VEKKKKSDKGCHAHAYEGMRSGETLSFLFDLPDSTWEVNADQLQWEWLRPFPMRDNLTKPSLLAWRSSLAALDSHECIRSFRWVGSMIDVCPASHAHVSVGMAPD